MKSSTEIAKEIFYLPCTNGQAEASIEKGAKLIDDYAAKFQANAEYHHLKTREGLCRVVGCSSPLYRWGYCETCFDQINS